LEDCQEMLNRISKLTPRVGKVEITDADVLQPLKQMFNDKTIVSFHVVVPTEPCHHQHMFMPKKRPFEKP
jgi:hypothetical protein